MEVPTLTIAVSSEVPGGLDADIGQHFGRCPAWTLVDVEGGAIRSARVVENPFGAGHAPGEVPRFVAGTGARVLLAGGIGRRAIQFFEELGVAVSGGHQTTVRAAVDLWLAGAAGGAEPCTHHEDADCGDAR